MQSKEEDRSPIILSLAVGGVGALIVLMLFFTIVMFSTSGCHASNVNNVTTAVIDCTTADNANEIAAVEARLKKITNWPDRYAHATAAGIVIGGCALLRVANDEPAPIVASASTSTEPDPGRATFEQFRREQAGGARFKTELGLR